MTKGLKVLRTVGASLAVLLMLATVLSFFIVPRFEDRKTRQMLGDPDAVVTDTARDPWICVSEDGTAQLNADYCLGVEEIVIPDAVNGVAVTSFTLNYEKPPAWVKRVVFPKTLRSIEQFPFNRWTGIEEIVFSEGIEDLSMLSIGQKENLKRLVLPRSVKKLNRGFFSWKDHPVEICYAGTEEEWLALGEDAAYLANRYTMVYEYGTEN